nr:unnamed protein product [Spirometra erinaceieuropaei]
MWLYGKNILYILLSSSALQSYLHLSLMMGSSEKLKRWRPFEGDDEKEGLLVALAAVVETAVEARELAIELAVLTTLCT